MVLTNGASSIKTDEKRLWQTKLSVPAPVKCLSKVFGFAIRHVA